MPGTSTVITLTHQVTYVEVEEKSDDDLTQCLVQLSTLPVAVREIFVIILLPRPKNWLQYQFIRFAMELAPMGRQPTMTPQGNYFATFSIDEISKRLFDSLRTLIANLIYHIF